MSRLLAILALALAPTVVRAQSAVLAVPPPAPPPAPDDAQPDLELRWLPLESRTSALDFAAHHVPGASRDLHGLRLRGGGAEDTAVLVDGLRLRHAALPMGMVQRLGVSTAGYGPQWADVPGGLVSLTSRTGDNRWRADVDLFRELGDRAVTVLAPTVSGPIVPDRLFYAVGLQGRLGSESMDLGPAAPSLSDRRIRSAAGALKLTWKPQAIHRVDSLTIVDADQQDGAELDSEPEAQPTFSTRTFFSSLRWTRLFGQRVLATGQVGFSRARIEERPESCRWNPACATVPAIEEALKRPLRQNWNLERVEHDTGVDGEAGLQALLFSRGRVTQEARLRSRLGLRWFSAGTHVPGDHIFHTANGEPVGDDAFFTSPGLGPADVGWTDGGLTASRSVLALESETRIWSLLAVRPALALVGSQARTSAGVTVRDLALAPQVSVQWDLTGDGRHVVLVSSRQRFDADLQRFARLALPTPYRRRCAWDSQAMSYSRDCNTSGGAGASVGSMRMARTWEHALQSRHALPKESRLGVEIVSRDTRRLPRVYPAGLVVSTDPADRSIYAGATISVEKRTGALQAFLAYTLALHRGELHAVYDPVVDNPGPMDRNGRFADDRRHTVHARLGWDLERYGWFAVAYAGASAPPSGGLVALDTAGSYEDYPGHLRSLSQGSYRRPIGVTAGRATHRLNLQMRVRTRRLLGIDLDFYADLINVLDDRDLRTDHLFNFRTDEPLHDERFARLGVEYRY